jgi:hypothetical protein
MPANPHYDPINGDRAYINGHVVTVIRKLEIVTILFCIDSGEFAEFTKNFQKIYLVHTTTKSGIRVPLIPHFRSTYRTLSKSRRRINLIENEYTSPLGFYLR